MGIDNNSSVIFVKMEEIECLKRKRNQNSLLLITKVVVTMCFLLLLAGAALSGVKRKHPILRTDKILRLVHVVSHHGEGTPSDTYPNDVYINNTFYPFGWGQLTDIGRKTQFANGLFLRRRYDDFLGNLYTPDGVSAYSASSFISYMSCSLILAGMWPTFGSPLNWNHHLNWSPIPVRNADNILLPRQYCLRYSEELENVSKLPDVQKINNQYAEIYEYLTKITGLQINSSADVESLYSTLKAEEKFGLRLPSWTKSYYPDKLASITEISYLLAAYNDELKRLLGGPLLKELISDWSKKVSGAQQREKKNLIVYSGHDSTLANLLISLGVWDKQIPVYGIMALFELYEDAKTKEFGVEILLRNTTSQVPYKLVIPGCEQNCPLSKLIELTKNVVPVDWSEECKP